MSQGNKRSFKSLKRGKNLEPLPTDLIIEILSRLPAKSIRRFCCLSKLWGSMLHRPYFSELFLTRSRTHPRILFAVEGDGDGSIYSAPQLHNPYETSSSPVVATDFHTKFSRYQQFSFRYVSGLVYISHKEMIFNPNTGQCAILPIRYRNSSRFLGFDPIDKQFKVLCMCYPYSDTNDDHRIMTLGTGESRWRKIQCPLNHYPLSDGICINGVIYYGACANIDGKCSVIVCFDVRSEKFKFLHAECLCNWFAKLINYKGNLGVIWLKYDKVDAIELRMWVREDVEKQEWSKYFYTLPETKLLIATKCFRRWDDCFR